MFHLQKLLDIKQIMFHVQLILRNCLQGRHHHPPQLLIQQLQQKKTAVTIHIPPVVNLDGNFTLSGFSGPTGYDYEEHVIMKSYDNDALFPPWALVKEVFTNDNDKVPLDVKATAVATTPTNIPYPPNIPHMATQGNDEDDGQTASTAARVGDNLTTSPEFQPSAGGKC